MPLNLPETAEPLLLLLSLLHAGMYSWHWFQPRLELEKLQFVTKQRCSEQTQKQESCTEGAGPGHVPAGLGLPMAGCRLDLANTLHLHPEPMATRPPESKARSSWLGTKPHTIRSRQEASSMQSRRDMAS